MDTDVTSSSQTGLDLPIDDSSMLDGEAEEQLEVPSEPPEKIPSNPKGFFVERKRLENEHPSWTRKEQSDYYRQVWSEQLSHKEQQNWRREHKAAKLRFERLLQLYISANPNFNTEEYYSRSSTIKSEPGIGSGGGSSSTASHASSNSSHTSSQPRRKRRNTSSSGGGGLGGGSFQIEGLDDSMSSRPVSGGPGDSSSSMSGVSSSSKRRRTNNNDYVESASTVDEILKNMNSSNRGKRSRRDALEETIADDKIRGFIDSLKSAAQDDWAANDEKQPALNMLGFLPRLSAELSREGVHEQYLDSGLLDGLRDWLTPLPDGSLPPMETRSEVLRLLSVMSLHSKESLRDYLEKSMENALDPSRQDDDLIPNKKGFAETVMNLWANPMETVANKRLLARLLRQWLRQLAQKNTSYAQVHQRRAAEQSLEILERQRIVRDQRKDFRSGPRKRARVLGQAHHDFAVQPNVVREDNGTAEMPAIRPSAAARLAARKKKKMSKSQRTLPSVTGRRKY